MFFKKFLIVGLLISFQLNLKPIVPLSAKPKSKSNFNFYLVLLVIISIVVGTIWLINTSDAKTEPPKTEPPETEPPETETSLSSNFDEKKEEIIFTKFGNTKIILKSDPSKIVDFTDPTLSPQLSLQLSNIKLVDFTTLMDTYIGMSQVKTLLEDKIQVQILVDTLTFLLQKGEPYARIFNKRTRFVNPFMPFEGSILKPKDSKLQVDLMVLTYIKDYILSGVLSEHKPKYAIHQAIICQILCTLNQMLVNQKAYFEHLNNPELTDAKKEIIITHLKKAIDMCEYSLFGSAVQNVELKFVEHVIVHPDSKNSTYFKTYISFNKKLKKDQIQTGAIVYYGFDNTPLYSKNTS
jgi:hypothetical protein